MASGELNLSHNELLNVSNIAMVGWTGWHRSGRAHRKGRKDIVGGVVGGYMRVTCKATVASLMPVEIRMPDDNTSSISFRENPSVHIDFGGGGGQFQGIDIAHRA